MVDEHDGGAAVARELLGPDHDGRHRVAAVLLRVRRERPERVDDDEVRGVLADRREHPRAIVRVAEPEAFGVVDRDSIGRQPVFDCFQPRAEDPWPVLGIEDDHSAARAVHACSARAVRDASGHRKAQPGLAVPAESRKDGEVPVDRERLHAPRRLEVRAGEEVREFVPPGAVAAIVQRVAAVDLLKPCRRVLGRLGRGLPVDDRRQKCAFVAEDALRVLPPRPPGLGLLATRAGHAARLQPAGHSPCRQSHMQGKHWCARPS